MKYLWFHLFFLLNEEFYNFRNLNQEQVGIERNKARIIVAWKLVTSVPSKKSKKIQDTFFMIDWVKTKNCMDGSIKDRTAVENLFII